MIFSHSLGGVEAIAAPKAATAWYIYSGGHRNGPAEIVSFLNFSEITSVKMTKSVRGKCSEKILQFA